MSDRVLRGNETVLLIPAYVDADGEVNGIHPGGVVPLNETTGLTTAILDYWIAVNTANHANANGGGNVSCAIKDDMTLGLTDSNADTDRTLCDEGQVEQLTSKNFDSKAIGFRDEDLSANGAYNLFHKLTFGPDVPYIQAHRIGAKQTALSSIGEVWDYYYVNTDVQIPQYADNANITTDVTFIPKNKVAFAATLAA